MNNKFFPAPEVEAIALRLINRHHENLQTTDWRTKQRARIDCVFCAETPVRNGMEIWGSARKVSGAAAFMRNTHRIDWAPSLTDEQIEAIEDTGVRRDTRKRVEEEQELKKHQANMPFFVITISKPRWDTLEHSQRVALVDHELMHCDVESDLLDGLKLRLVPHDFEGFYREAERHGAWRPPARQILHSMKKGEQMRLELDDEEDDEDEDFELSKLDAMLSPHEMEDA